MAAKHKHDEGAAERDKNYDTVIGRSHLIGYEDWPPPTHIVEHLNVFVDFISSKTTGSILDLGCGDGSIDRLLAECSPKRQITGVDLEAHEQWGLKKPSNLKFQASSIYDLPFEPKSFDIVIMKDVLHHMPDPDKVLREVSKLAKKQVVIIEANRYNPISYIRMVKVARHEHFSRRNLKRIIGKSHNLTSAETHVWPAPLRRLGKINDLVFNMIPLLGRLRNYNFVIFKP